MSNLREHCKSTPRSMAMNHLYWIIQNELAGMPMPFIHPERRLNSGGPLTAYQDELTDLHETGIRAVVSLLNITSDERVYSSAGFSFLCLPINDGDAPSRIQVEMLTKFIDLNLMSHRPVAIHCEAGLGRTGTALAAYLIVKGNSFTEAIGRVRAVEPSAIETNRQIEFLHQIASPSST